MHATVACNILPYGCAHTRKAHASLVLSIFRKGWKKHRANLISFTLMLAALATGGLPELDLANVSLLTKFICPNPSVSFGFPETLRLIQILGAGQVCNRLNNGTFPGTSLSNCTKLARDIKTCQAKGKLVTLSLGGAVGNVSFAGDDQAKEFADTVWNLFLGGSSDTRPFGNAILDG